MCTKGVGDNYFNYVELIGPATDCRTEPGDKGGCVFQLEAKRGQIASQLKFGEELLLLALKEGAQSGWPRMIPPLFYLCHLINFLWQVLNKVI